MSLNSTYLVATAIITSALDIKSATAVLTAITTATSIGASTCVVNINNPAALGL
jgi:hypothetical protein